MTPLFSIITPVYNPPAAILERTLASVRSQTFTDWEHCLVDDAADASEVWPLLERAAAADPRIKVERASRNGGIVAASNAALAGAGGHYVALLDHDDELAPDALELMAQAIAADEEVDFLYSDEDKIDPDGYRFEPFVKPAWSPDRLLGHMYTSHLSVYRRSLVEEVGGFRRGLDGSQDWDLALRIGERTGRIARVPRTLYHWRALDASAASSVHAKPWAHEASRRAVNDHLRRLGVEARAEQVPGYVGNYWLRPQLREEPLVSVVIPSAGKVDAIDGIDRPLVVNCVETLLERSTYENLEVVVVADSSFPEDVAAELTAVAARRLRIVSDDAPFNFSARVNLGVRESHGDYLLLLNDDVEPVPAGWRPQPDPAFPPLPEWPLAAPDGGRSWIEAMLAFARQPAVGAVGAKLYFPDGRIQHAGVIAVDGEPRHAYYGAPGGGIGYASSLLLACNYLAVTAACLMTTRSAFESAGGFSEDLPVNYNDVDFCLKLREQGQRSVCVPWVELLHRESSSRGPGSIGPEELPALRAKWPRELAHDPFYDARFRDGNFTLAVA